MVDDWMDPPRPPKTTAELDLVRVGRSGKLMTHSQKKWLDRFLKQAEDWSTYSKDPRTQVGATVVGQDQRNVCHGYNGFPHGVVDSPERLNDPEVKYHFTVHAERAAIYNAMFDLTGATLYCTMHPCSECAKTIVAKRFACVVCPPAPEREPWGTSSKYAREMFDEAGIEVITIEPVY